MERPFGDLALAQALEALSNEVMNYFGAVVEMQNNLRREALPDKPVALVYTEQILDTGHLLFSGGLMDQPYIFMREFKICRDLIGLFQRQQAALQSSQNKE